ncbi:MAG: site-2 protease family protein [Armatimonadetes bacterium]|nr:site-2 protease family protein [Armatimonadota bacterium]
MDLIFEYLKTGIIFMVMLTILVAVHEFGHFWVARLFGMEVEAFAVMMGGVRKTDLASHLKNPIVSASRVWLLTAIALSIFLIGQIQKIEVLALLGLVSLGIVIPVWVATRLTALYHLPGLGALQTLGTTWIVGLALLGFATKFQGIGFAQVLGILFFASVVGLLFGYYNPVLGKHEDAPMGKGTIDVEGKSIPVEFRPVLSRKDRHGTEFSLLLLPLGGFARIKGMEPKEDGSETKIVNGFYQKSAFARFMTLFAGPLFSVLLGVLIFTVAFMAIGVPTKKPIIGFIESGAPADKAGLKQGDLITAIDGKPIAKWVDMVFAVRDSAGVPLHFTVLRKDKSLELTIVPTQRSEATPVMGPDGEFTDQLRKQAKIGAAPGTEPLGPIAAFGRAWIAPIETVKGLVGILKAPSTAKDQVGGPASIAKATHDASNEGPAPVIMLAGLLSVSLGIMNLLPIVPLDGGQMIVALAEMLRGGSRLSIQVQRAIQAVGFVLIMGLMFFILIVDIGRNVGVK